MITFLLQTQVLPPLPMYDTLAMNWIGLLFQVHCGQASEVDHKLFQDYEKNIISMTGYQSCFYFCHQYITLLHTKFNGKITCWQTDTDGKSWTCISMHSSTLTYFFLDLSSITLTLEMTGGHHYSFLSFIHLTDIVLYFSSLTLLCFYYCIFYLHRKTCSVHLRCLGGCSDECWI